MPLFQANVKNNLIEKLDLRPITIAPIDTALESDFSVPNAIRLVYRLTGMSEEMASMLAQVRPAHRAMQDRGLALLEEFRGEPLASIPNKSGEKSLPAFEF